MLPLPALRAGGGVRTAVAPPLLLPLPVHLNIACTDTALPHCLPEACLLA